LSIHALSWAFKQTLEKSSEKLTLLCLCNYADTQGYCYPSLARIAKEGSQDAKTVTASIKALIEAGLIRDSGHRIGRTKAITVWQVILTESSSTKNGDTSSQAPPFLNGSPTVFPDKLHRFSDEATPKTVDRSYQGSVIKPSEDPPKVLNTSKPKMSEEESERHRAAFRRGLAELKTNLGK
jgi:hypothetical protein